MQNNVIATSAVSFELPFCLYLDDGLYELFYSNQPGAIQIWRRPRYSDVADLPFNRGGFIMNIDPLNCEVTGDRFGRVAYSEVIIYFPSSASATDPQYLIEHAVNYINRLIEVYRTATGEFWVQPISLADVLSISCRHCDENGNKVQGLSYSGPQGGATGGKLSIISSGSNAIKRSSDIHNRIKDILHQDIKIPIYTNLMLDALTSIRNATYELSVVQSQNAFENFFYTFVTYELTSRGSMSPELQQQLNLGNITRTMNKRLAGTSKMSKLTYFSKLVTKPPRSFAEDIPEYDNWYTDTYTLRNEVIHSGKNDVTQKQAEDAFKSVEIAIAFFNQQDWKNLTFR